MRRTMRGAMVLAAAALLACGTDAPSSGTVTPAVIYTASGTNGTATLSGPYVAFRFDLSVPEPDENYSVEVALSGETGTPASGATVVAAVQRHPDNFVVYLAEPPGDSGSVTYAVAASGLRNGGTLLPYDR